MECRTEEGGKAVHTGRLEGLFRASCVRKCLLSADFFSGMSITSTLLLLRNSSLAAGAARYLLWPQGSAWCKQISPLMPHCTVMLLEGGSMSKAKPLQYLSPAPSLCSSGYMNAFLLLSRSVVQCSAGEEPWLYTLVLLLRGRLHPFIYNLYKLRSYFSKFTHLNLLSQG